jgi:zinc transporter ZupT
LLDAMLGFAGGVMIAASMFGLLVPAFRLGGIPVVVLGSIMGVLFLDRANLLGLIFMVSLAYSVSL